MSKIKENKTLASEIIADQESKNKKMELAVVALSVALLATVVTKGKENEQSFVLYGNYGRNRSVFHSGNRAVVDKWNGCMENPVHQCSCFKSYFPSHNAPDREVDRWEKAIKPQ